MVYFNSIEERCEALAKYLIDNKTTVRDTAHFFGISKSTVHKDVTEKLMKINLPMHKTVSAILQQNKLERHLRGGEATRIKYKQIK